MKKLFAVILVVAFLLSLFAGSVAAQEQEENSVVYDGWGSYVSTGDASVNVFPVVYFTRRDVVVVQVNIHSNLGDANTFGGFVKAYHWTDPFYSDTNMGSEELYAFDHDVEPTSGVGPDLSSPVGCVTYVTAGDIAPDTMERTFVRLDIVNNAEEMTIADQRLEVNQQSLLRQHSFVADADHVRLPHVPFTGDLATAYP